MNEAGQELCRTPFQVFTGRTLAGGSSLGYVESSLNPLPSAWEAGARHIICTVEKPSSALSTGSAKGRGAPVTT